MFRYYNVKFTKAELTRIVLNSGVGEEGKYLTDPLAEETLSAIRNDKRPIKLAIREKFLTAFESVSESFAKGELACLPSDTENDLMNVIFQAIENDDSVSDQLKEQFKQKRDNDNFSSFMANTLIYAITRDSKSKNKSPELSEEFVYTVLKLSPKEASETPENADKILKRVNDNFTFEQPTTHHNLPPRNIHFMAYGNTLEEISDKLKKSKTSYTAHPQALVIRNKSDGVGKSTTAFEYGQICLENNYSVVWVFDARSSQSLKESTASFAVNIIKADLKQIDSSLDMEAIIRDRFRLWLEGYSHKWLLIFDDVLDFNSIEKYLPTKGNGEIIITTRLMGFPNWFRGESMQLAPFDPETATRFLIQRTGLNDTANTIALAEKLAERLKYLPCELENAGSYIASEGSVGLAEYLAEVDFAITKGFVPKALQSDYIKPITRGEFASLAVTLYEHIRGDIKGRVKFLDDEHNIDVRKAVFLGLMSGVDDKRFMPNRKLTREDIAVLLLELNDAIYNGSISDSEMDFRDKNSISLNAVYAAEKICGAKIMDVVGDNDFRPRGLYTRERCIASIKRLYDMYNAQKDKNVVGWGPERALFSIQKPPGYNVFNSITDNPNIRDERNFVNIREAGSNDLWSYDIELFPGKEYDIRLYVHNAAAEGYGLVAEDVRAMINVPKFAGRLMSVCGIIDSSNTNPRRVHDGARMRSDRDFSIKIVPGSTRFYNKHWGATGVAIPDSVFTSQGALLGYDALDGRIPGGFRYAGVLVFAVRPQFAENQKK